MDQKDFIAKLAPLAIEQQKRTGVLASITLAQGALESNWGKSAPNNNLFGIKGGTASKQTKEFINGQWITTTANFRSYPDWSGSVKDHSDFLVVNKRYTNAGFFDFAKKLDYVGCANALQKAGYATDPQYAQKLINLIRAYNLEKFDLQGAVEMDAKVANQIISYLSKAWSATSDATEKKTLNGLANELRKISGQAIQ